MRRLTLITVLLAAAARVGAQPNPLSAQEMRAKDAIARRSEGPLLRHRAPVGEIDADFGDRDERPTAFRRPLTRHQLDWRGFRRA